MMLLYMTRTLRAYQAVPTTMSRTKNIPEQRQVEGFNYYYIDSSITEAISKFPVLTNCTDLRSFFGLVNQLSSSTATVDELLLETNNLQLYMYSNMV